MKILLSTGECKEAALVVTSTLEKMKSLPQQAERMTVDKGKEFARHQEIKRHLSRAGREDTR